MGRTVKEVSEKNEYHIDGERQLELEHFCKQYENWRKEYHDAIKLELHFDEVKSTDISDPTFVAVNRSIKYRNNMEMVNKCIDTVINDTTFSSEYEREQTKGMLILNVTKGTSWLPFVDGLCSRPKFYVIRRKFFWLLDQVRG